MQSLMILNFLLSYKTFVHKTKTKNVNVLVFRISLLGKKSFLRISCAMVLLIPIKVRSRNEYQVGHSNRIYLMKYGICRRGVSL